ncbi:UNVERIFIED_CONTAM: hypothetical protein Slati_2092200 [Sesamum latifolium]|uniref:Reverse transcriptase zinc-binding domain-containing protein n=1 Tax=Sesamum latifolium TaxID=2727402 RepID=A0AAW2WPP8_9LAMI
MALALCYELEICRLLVLGGVLGFGNGESVLIVGFPWLPRPVSFQVTSQPKSLQGSTKVAELLNETGWNESLVTEEFNPIDSECILSIPLPSARCQDEILWHYGKQSAYKLACDLASSAASSHNPHKWDFVWGLHLAPKIRLFIWILCTFARLVWAMSGVDWKLVKPCSEDIEEWFRGIYHRADRSDYQMAAALCWCLCYNRNLMVCEGTGLQAMEVVETASRQIWSKDSRLIGQKG